MSCGLLSGYGSPVTPVGLLGPGNGIYTILRPFNKSLPIVTASVPEGCENTAYLKDLSRPQRRATLKFCSVELII
jgi:hypothetical protein